MPVSFVRMLFGSSDEDVLEAFLAACTLAASADGEVSQAEQIRMHHLLKSDPLFQGFDARTAERLLADQFKAVRANMKAARAALDKKLARLSGDPDRPRKAMRLAYAVMAADLDLGEAEQREFRRLCDLVGLDGEATWEEVSLRFLVWDDTNEIALVKAPSMRTARIVNESIYTRWKAYETLDEAKAAAIGVVRKALDHRSEQGLPAEDLESYLERLPDITTAEVPNYDDYYS